jgi:uncharacterized protein YuzE
MTWNSGIYFRLDESEIVESEEVHPGIILDFNKQNQVVAVEVLRVKSRIPLASLKKCNSRWHKQCLPMGQD